MLVFPEDLGGHRLLGPASVRQLREFQVLECDHDARRGAGFLCQLAHRKKTPFGHPDHSLKASFGSFYGMAAVRESP